MFHLEIYQLTLWYNTDPCCCAACWSSSCQQSQRCVVAFPQSFCWYTAVSAPVNRWVEADRGLLPPVLNQCMSGGEAHKVLWNSETQLRGFGSLDGVWRSEKSCFSKAGWKVMYKPKMLEGWSLEQSWNKSPKLYNLVQTQPCSCRWIQALIRISDAPQLRFRVPSQAHICKNTPRASMHPYIFSALHRFWETKDVKDLEIIASNQGLLDPHCSWQIPT